MTKTVTQIAKHRINLAPGTTIAPHEVFECPADQVAWLQAQGACEDYEKPKQAKVAEEKKVEVSDSETERLAALAKAKEMGIKGLRKDSKIETIREKIAEAEAAAAAEESDATDADATSEDEDETPL